MPEPMRRSPLAALAQPERSVAGPAPVTLEALPFGGKLILRAAADVAASAADSLGFALPALLQGTGNGAIEALCLGPDEWLLLVGPAEVEVLAAALRAGLAGHHHAVVDVTDRFTGIAVSGTHAADVLAAGCPLDLHPRIFRPGMVTRTLLGKATVVLRRPDRGDRFELYVNGSFAPYVWLFLENAGREFGIAVAA